MNSGSFQDRIWRLLDGELSAEEFAELEKFLEESPEEQDQFVEQVDLHNLLGQRLSHTASMETRLHGVVRMDHILARQKRKALRNASIAAAAVLVLAAVIFSLVLVPKPRPLLSFRASEDSILSVTHLAGGGKECAPRTMAKGSRLLLRQGAVELTLASGVTAVVTAPADLTLVREDRIYQRGGRALFQVPAKAIGFQVQTPDLLITDLGTEFGVISGSEVPGEVHVFKGRVEVSHQHGVRRTEVLTGPVARMAGPAGNLAPTPLRAEEFLKSLQPRIPHLRFSFDSMDGTMIPVEGDHPDVSAISAWRMPGKTAHAGPALVDGKFGKALRLHGAGDHVQTNWPGISGRAARTVAVWLRLPQGRPERAWESILVWGDTRDSAGKFVMTWNFIPECGQLGALRFGCRDGYVVGTTDLRDGRWHHLAIVFGGEPDPQTRMPVRLYVDGKAEEISGWRYSNPETVPGWDGDTWMSIGRFFDADISPRGTLKGELDELYIFSGILTEQGIRRLMDAGW